MICDWWIEQRSYMVTRIASNSHARGSIRRPFDHCDSWPDSPPRSWRGPTTRLWHRRDLAQPEAVPRRSRHIQHSCLAYESSGSPEFRGLTLLRIVLETRPSGTTSFDWPCFSLFAKSRPSMHPRAACDFPRLAAWRKPPHRRTYSSSAFYPIFDSFASDPSRHDNRSRKQPSIPARVWPLANRQHSPSSVERDLWPISDYRTIHPDRGGAHRASRCPSSGWRWQHPR